MTDTHDDTLVLPAAPPLPTAAAAAINTFHIHFPHVLPVSGKAVVAGASVARKAVSKPAATTSGTTPAVSAPKPALRPTADIKPEYQTDAITGASSRIYQDTGGNQAIFIADPSDHNKVTLKIKTQDSTELITYGHERGFNATVNGKSQEADPFRVGRDTLHCGDKKADISTNQTESVTRDKLQQFAKAHPELAQALKGVDLPVAVAGALPINFKQAVEKPTEYRACPKNDTGIVLERLTEKSAIR